MAPTTPIGSRTISELPIVCSQVKSAATWAMEAKVAIGRPTWTSWDRTSGIPTSWVMRSARDSIRAARPSLTAVRSAVRSSTGVADHAGKAAAAAVTARSMSSTVPSGTVPMTSSVVESMTSMVSDPDEGTQPLRCRACRGPQSVMDDMALPPLRGSTGPTSHSTAGP